MSFYYLDTSALVKRYAREVGTEWVTALHSPADGHILYTVRLTGPEMVAALGRKARTGSLTSDESHGAIWAFREAWERRYRVTAVTASVAELGMNLAEQHGLRGYDSVHLAAALTVAATQESRGLPPIIFVSADSAQRTAAVAEGLPVVDPNAYP